MGGGNQRYGQISLTTSGLSPRGRGKRKSASAAGRRHRSIPAWAGETRKWNRTVGNGAVYPRVGGGNRPNRRATSKVLGLSPRGRGKPRALFCARQRIRSIPAWAGETLFCVGHYLQVRVYPRVGGGNGDNPNARSSQEGLSPRGRGKLSVPSVRTG